MCAHFSQNVKQDIVIIGLFYLSLTLRLNHKKKKISSYLVGHAARQPLSHLASGIGGKKTQILISNVGFNLVVRAIM